MRECALFVIVAAGFLLAGCATQKPMYYWGRYEDLVYEMYREPGKATPEAQIAKLGEDMQRAEANGQKVPPGVRAHLGYMYYVQGNLDSAANEFEEEKRTYPEATVFVDGLLRRMRGSP